MSADFVAQVDSHGWLHCTVLDLPSSTPPSHAYLAVWPFVAHVLRWHSMLQANMSAMSVIAAG